MKIYYYDKNKPITISEEAIKQNPHTYGQFYLWELKSINSFFSLVPIDQKTVIIDVGAQSGLYSLYAKYLPNATFHSFEMFYPNYKLLLQNLLVNEISNVIPYNIGISDTNAETVLNICPNHNGLHTIGKNPNFKSVEYKGKTITIDSLNLDKVDFIKIDTEGHEYFILKGAEKTLLRCKPTLQLEWSINNMKQCSVTEQMMSDYLDSLYYKCVSTIDEEKIFKFTE